MPKIWENSPDQEVKRRVAAPAPMRHLGHPLGLPEGRSLALMASRACSASFARWILGQGGQLATVSSNCRERRSDSAAAGGQTRPHRSPGREPPRSIHPVPILVISGPLEQELDEIAGNQDRRYDEEDEQAQARWDRSPASPFSRRLTISSAGAGHRIRHRAMLPDDHRTSPDLEVLPQPFAVLC